jgi:hypothetical protein
MRHFSVLAVFLAVLFVSNSLAQDKVGGNDPTPFFYSVGNGNTINPMLTTVQPAPQQFSPEKQSLLNQIRVAKENNNTVLLQQLNNTLNEMSGSVSAELVNDETVGVRSDYQGNNNVRAPFVQDPDYAVTTLNGAGNWAVATATSHRSTAIFAATTEYFSGAGDQMKVYVSYNGGATWVLKYTFNGFVAEVDMRTGELDCEPVISGSDTLLFVSYGYTFNGHAFSRIDRVNIAAGTGTGGAYAFGGYTGTSFQTYNPRLTSDNTNYTGAAYVYVTVSIDSVTSGGNSKITQRFGVFLTPVTNNTLTYRVANAAGPGFWWHSTTATGTYLWQDICYYSTGSDRVYTVFNHTPLNTLYLAWSNDYGVTNGGSATIAETVEITRARIAANGGPTNQNICIGYRRFFSATDYDFRAQFTTTGGTTGASYTPYYPEFTSNNSRLVDLQAIDLANGRYVFAYASQNNANHYFRQTNNSGVAFGTAYQTNNLPADSVYGGVRAGYRAGGSADSSLVIWQRVQGTGAYCSYNIASTVGISNNGNEIPNVFSLSQNYPNPFNPVTNIKFTIPANGLVKLVVFDVLGREVATILNDNMTAGSYTADFDASSLSSGVYFYTLTSGNFTDTKRMVLVK